MTDSRRSYLVCRCVSARRIPETALRRLAAAAEQAGIAVDYVDDFCVAAAHAQGPLFSPSPDSDVTLFACSRRAAEGLRQYAADKTGIDIPPVSFQDLASKSVDAICHDLGLSLVEDADGVPPEPAAPAPAPQTSSAADLKAAASAPNTDWFPVIDRARCVNCGQCAQFCLFGVYRADENGVIRVVRPFSCKNGCPACARVCPHRAVIFPKHADPAINGTLEADAIPPEPTEAQQSLQEQLAARRRQARKNLFND